MHARGIPFYVSGCLWNAMLRHWFDVYQDKKSGQPEQYFLLKPKTFEEFISQKSGSIFEDNRAEIAAL